MLINANIKMYIFDHLRMYTSAYSSSCVMYSLNRYDFPVMFTTCAWCKIRSRIAFAMTGS